MRERWKARRAWRRTMFLGLRTLLRAVGFARARTIGIWLGELQFRLGGRLRNSLQRDIAQALGRRDDDPSVSALLREAYRVNNGALLEVMSMLDRRQSVEQLAKSCELDGLDNVRMAMSGGRGAILLGAHMGNMALVTIRLMQAGWPVSVVYRDAKMMSAGFLQSGLEQYGVQGILANSGIRAYAQMLTALKQGRIVCVMLDQGIGTAENGMVHRFLGKNMSMSAGPAQLARSSRAPMLPVAMKVAAPVWKFEIQPPLPLGSGSLESDVELMTRWTESQILRTPQFWSWHHRRWSHLPIAPAQPATLPGTPGEGRDSQALPVESTQPLPSETNDAAVWVLLGKWHGDNQQLLALAEALKLPIRVVPLRFNAASLLPPALLGASRLSWRSDAPLSPPWPRVVLAAGRRGVPAARWIQRQSAGHTRLISVNRPWSPMSWFDLIITTPQYALPARPNVQSNLMPFLPPAEDVSPPSALPDVAHTLPRPWTVVLVGGNSRPMRLCDATAASLAEMVNEQVRRTGGSAWIVDSPRTPSSAMAVIQGGLEVPATTVSWRDGKPLYRALLDSGDSFIVTEDSASMVTEALLTGRPVKLCRLSRHPDWFRRAVSAWRVAAERAPASIVGRGFEAAVESGLLAAARDLGLLHRALENAGMFDGTGSPQALAEQERQVTLARIHALIDGS